MSATSFASLKKKMKYTSPDTAAHVQHALILARNPLKVTDYTILIRSSHSATPKNVTLLGDVSTIPHTGAILIKQVKTSVYNYVGPDTTLIFPATLSDGSPLVVQAEHLAAAPVNGVYPPGDIFIACMIDAIFENVSDVKPRYSLVPHGTNSDDIQVSLAVWGSTETRNNNNCTVATGGLRNVLTPLDDTLYLIGPCTRRLNGTHVNINLKTNGGIWCLDETADEFVIKFMNVAHKWVPVDHSLKFALMGDASSTEAPPQSVNDDGPVDRPLTLRRKSLFK